jgi:hypothetical protein
MEVSQLVRRRDATVSARALLMNVAVVSTIMSVAALIEVADRRVLARDAGVGAR